MSDSTGFTNSTESASADTMAMSPVTLSKGMEHNDFYPDSISWSLLAAQDPNTNVCTKKVANFPIGERAAKKLEAALTMVQMASGVGNQADKEREAAQTLVHIGSYLNHGEIIRLEIENKAIRPREVGEEVTMLSDVSDDGTITAPQSPENSTLYDSSSSHDAPHHDIKDQAHVEADEGEPLDNGTPATPIAPLKLVPWTQDEELWFDLFVGLLIARGLEDSVTIRQPLRSQVHVALSQFFQDRTVVNKYGERETWCGRTEGATWCRYRSLCYATLKASDIVLTKDQGAVFVPAITEEVWNSYRVQQPTRTLRPANADAQSQGEFLDLENDEQTAEWLDIYSGMLDMLPDKSISTNVPRRRRDAAGRFQSGIVHSS